MCIHMLQIIHFDGERYTGVRKKGERAHLHFLCASTYAGSGARGLSKHDHTIAPLPSYFSCTFSVAYVIFVSSCCAQTQSATEGEREGQEELSEVTFICIYHSIAHPIRVCAKRSIVQSPAAAYSSTKPNVIQCPSCLCVRERERGRERVSI